MKNFYTLKHAANLNQEGSIDEIYWNIQFIKWQLKNDYHIYNENDRIKNIDKFNTETNQQLLQNRFSKDKSEINNQTYILMQPDLIFTWLNNQAEANDNNTVCILQRENQQYITLLDYELMDSNTDNCPYGIYIMNEQEINQDLLINIHLQHIYMYKNNQFNILQTNYYNILLQLCLIDCKYQSVKQFKNLKILALIDVKNIQLSDLQQLQDLKQITVEKCLNVKDIFDYLTLDIEFIDIKNSMLNYEIIIRKHMPYLRYLKLFLVRSKKLILQYNLSALEFLSLDIELELMYRMRLQNLVCIELCHNQQKELHNLALYNCPQLVFVKIVKLYKRNLILRPGQILQYKNYRIDLLNFQVYNTYLDSHQIIQPLNKFSEFSILLQEILATIRYLYIKLTSQHLQINFKMLRAEKLHEMFKAFQICTEPL